LKEIVMGDAQADPAAPCLGRFRITPRSKGNLMKKPWFVVLVLLALIPALVDAQGGGRGRGGGGKGGGGRGGNDSGGKQDEGTTSKPHKPADLSALSITAKWKDAKTLEITATVKNVSTEPFMGTRTVTLKFAGKDGKVENVKEETLPGIAAGESHTFKVDLTDKKYFEKDLKWTLEIAAGDPNASNDKKIVSLNPGPPPKG
jgi:hypothetical protein